MPDFVNVFFGQDGKPDLSKLPSGTALRALLGPIGALGKQFRAFLAAVERAKLAGLQPTDSMAVSMAYGRFLKARDDIAQTAKVPAPLMELAIDLTEAYQNLDEALAVLEAWLGTLLAALLGQVGKDNDKVLSYVKGQIAAGADPEALLWDAFRPALAVPVKKQKAQKARQQKVKGRQKAQDKKLSKTKTAVQQQRDLAALKQAALEGRVPPEGAE